MLRRGIIDGQAVDVVDVLVVGIGQGGREEDHAWGDVE